MSKYERPPSPGKLRPNQIITSYGPGAIFQTENDSVIIMGLHTWYKKQLKPIHHPVLEGSTGKKGFFMPEQHDREEVIPCKSFPLWGVCSDKYCRRLQKHADIPDSDSEEFKCVETNCNHANADRGRLWRQGLSLGRGTRLLSRPRHRPTHSDCDQPKR